MAYSFSDSEENEMEFEDESPAVVKKPAAVVQKPAAFAKKQSPVQNVNDEGSSDNDSKPLAQFFGKKGSNPQQGEVTKKKKRSGSGGKSKEKGKQRKPATSKKKNEMSISLTECRKCALEAEKATVAKSATTPVTRSETSNKRHKGDV
jgi:hypothetical protein